ncbi:MAG: CapA family protein [Spirochaetes bacterium]|nr:CapA family protein [Spirochaetota bacterium]
MKKTIFTIVLIPFILVSCASQERAPARISFTGDIIMHIPVKSCAREQNMVDAATKNSLNNNGFDFLFARIRDTLKRSDEVVGNMEFPVSPPFTSLPMVFNCHPSVLRAMKGAGFTVMSVANNHLLDQGQRGARNTLRYVREAGLGCIGAGLTDAEARAGIVRDVGGIRVGLISYTGVLNDPLPARGRAIAVNLLLDRDRVTADIIDMKRRSDYLIMVVHDGDEYALEPSESTRELLAHYIDSGVDLVVGHHPHLLQPARKLRSADGRDCYIFYSLGNFISNQGSRSRLPGGGLLSTRDSVVLTLLLSRSGKELRTAFEIVLITTVNARESAWRRVIQVVPFADLLRETGNRGDAVAAAEPAAMDPALRKDLQGRLASLRETLFRYGPLPEVRIVER